MNKLTPAGLAIIKKFEGYSPTPYICPGGWWTIGYGSVRDAAGELVTAATPPITKELGEQLLLRDIRVAERAVKRWIRVPLNDNQYSALVSFTFNLGAGSLQRSTLRQKLNRKDFAGAATEFSKWVRAGGRVLAGLVRRRKAEQMLFLSQYRDTDEANEWYNTMWGLQLTR